MRDSAHLAVNYEKTKSIEGKVVMFHSFSVINFVRGWVSYVIILLFTVTT